MPRSKMLPLGVDIGTSRARIAVAESDGKHVRLRAVASRDIIADPEESPSILAALLEEMIGELGVRERRCIAALGGETAALRIVRLPKMSWQERLRAARYESQTFAPAAEDCANVVRVHRAKDAGAFIIGVTPKDRLHDCVGMLRLAKLNPVAVDHDTLAFRRALSHADAILDVGSERSTLHVYSASAPFSYHAAAGGAEVTRRIARELSIDLSSAERRKRILGSAGAGVSVRNSLVADLDALVERARSRATIARISLVGNGARLPGLATELESVSGALVELPVASLLETDAYPEDVLRAAAPDWTLAAALCTWSVVA